MESNDRADVPNDIMMTLVVEFHSNCASQLCLVSKEIDEA